MPIYDYTCKGCGEKFSDLVPSCNTPDSEVVCPKCNQAKAVKALSMKTAPAVTSATGAACGSGGSGFA